MIRLLFVLSLLFMPLLQTSAPPAVTLPVCSAAVHAAYTATGPDGQEYPTWHPQIDATHGCAFDHEHGSDPALFLAGVNGHDGYHPAFGYSAARMGMNEGNAGFKAYAFQQNGYRWYIVQHFGTAHPESAACVFLHTLDIAAADSSGALVADLHLMADFGKSVSNGTHGDLAPPACPTQAADAAARGSTGIRQIPVADDENTGYEPWRVDDAHPLPFFSSGALTLNTPNAQAACDTVTCTMPVQRSDVYDVAAKGTFRFLTFNAGFRVHATAQYSNTFMYDGAQQYLAPGIDLRLDSLRCEPYNAMAYWYDCSGARHDENPFRLNPFIVGAN